MLYRENSLAQAVLAVKGVLLQVAKNIEGLG